MFCKRTVFFIFLFFLTIISLNAFCVENPENIEITDENIEQLMLKYNVKRVKITKEDRMKISSFVMGTPWRLIYEGKDITISYSRGDMKRAYKNKNELRKLFEIAGGKALKNINLFLNTVYGEYDYLKRKKVKEFAKNFVKYFNEFIKNSSKEERLRISNVLTRHRFEEAFERLEKERIKKLAELGYDKNWFITVNGAFGHSIGFGSDIGLPSDGITIIDLPRFGMFFGKNPKLQLGFILNFSFGLQEVGESYSIIGLLEGSILFALKGSLFYGFGFYFGAGIFIRKYLGDFTDPDIAFENRVRILNNDKDFGFSCVLGIITNTYVTKVKLLMGIRINVSFKNTFEVYTPSDELVARGRYFSVLFEIGIGY